MNLTFIPMLAGIYLIIYTFFVTSKGYLNKLAFQVIPFFVGLATILYAVKEYGWLG